MVDSDKDDEGEGGTDSGDEDDLSSGREAHIHQVNKCNNS